MCPDELPLEGEDDVESGEYTDAVDIERILDHLVADDGDAELKIALCTDRNDEDSFFAQVSLDGGDYAKDGAVYRFYDEDEENGVDFNAEEVVSIEVDDDTYEITVELNHDLEH